MEDTTGVSLCHEGLNLLDCPKLRLVLLGVREAGKSAVGNAILGRKAFDEVGVKTKESVSSQGLVRGRDVLVIDTPGWEWFNLNGTSASSWVLKKEMMRSMSLCQPGAHALLLVVPLSFSFSKRERCAVEEHIELFGQEAWNYTIVIFTVLDRKQLRGSNLKHEVEDNDELHSLVERCGGRFHALYSKPKGGDDQVSDLLDKIQEMMAVNEDAVLSSEKVLDQAREKEKEEERREMEEKKERDEKIQKVRRALKTRDKDEAMSRRTARHDLRNVEQTDSSRMNMDREISFRDRVNFRENCKQQ